MCVNNTSVYIYKYIWSNIALYNSIGVLCLWQSLLYSWKNKYISILLHLFLRINKRIKAIYILLISLIFKFPLRTYIQIAYVVCVKRWKLYPLKAYSSKYTHKCNQCIFNTLRMYDIVYMYSCSLVSALFLEERYQLLL